MKKLTIAVLFAAASVNVFAYDNFNLNGIKAKDIKEGNVAVTPAAEIPSAKPITINKVTLPQPLKEWTFMAFMNGKNNIGNFGILNIKEMEQVGTTDKVNVVVEYGQLKKGVKRYMVTKHGLPLPMILSPVLQDDKNADMGDYNRLVDFIKWTKTNFPAKRYMLVIWNHGIGWIDPNLQPAAAPTKGLDFHTEGISFDEETGNYIKTVQLPEVFRQSGKEDIYMSNACLMQMAEVTYEIKDYTDAIVGSEEVMLGFGYDYARMLGFLNQNASLPTEEIAKNFVSEYQDFYINGLQLGPLKIPFQNVMGFTLSAVRPSAMNGLPEKLDAFAGAMMDNNETEAVKYAVTNVTRFHLMPDKDKPKMMSSYGDLGHFVKLAADKASSEDVKAKAQDLLNYLDNDVIIAHTGFNKDFSGFDMTNTHGLSIELTRRQALPPGADARIYGTKYEALDLSQASKWPAFLDWSNAEWAKK